MLSDRPMKTTHSAATIPSIEKSPLCSHAIDFATATWLVLLFAVCLFWTWPGVSTRPKHVFSTQCKPHDIGLSFIGLFFTANAAQITVRSHLSLGHIAASRTRRGWRSVTATQPGIKPLLAPPVSLLSVVAGGCSVCRLRAHPKHRLFNHHAAED